MIRVGLGYDIHRFKKGRHLVLGGVKIKSCAGLDGHSDADVLVHSIMDAILGAAGLRDIGFYFPSNDRKYKNVSSLVLLEKVYRMAAGEGYALGNIDSSLVAEKPKVSGYIDEMKNNIAGILHCDKSSVGIKATTNEALGAIGRCEGVASFSVCLLIKNQGK